MEVSHVRQLLKTRKIGDLNLKVVYYARVSTDKEEQKTSIKAQQEYYSGLIKNNKNWSFLGGYVDEGISGIQATKREQFQKMISDAHDGKFDLIITKEISRFARNTLDSISYTRELLNCGVCVWFQNDGINTIDDDSEFRLTIMAGVAQDEIRKLSSRVKFGHAQAIKNGTVFGNSRIYGYEKEHGKLVINEYEAGMVREIFEKYATGKWSTPRIEKYLEEQGYVNHKGGAINRGTIQHIIQNPKYKGYYVGGKVKIEDLFTKKQYFVPQEEWVMYKDSGDRVPAIVSEELWNKANEVFKERSKAIKSRRTSFKTKNLFTGKIYCGVDGSPYYMRQRGVRGHQDFMWNCSYRIKHGADSCPSFTLYESELKKMYSYVLQNALENSSELIDFYMKIFERIVDEGTEDKEDEVVSKILVLEKKKEKILSLFLNDKISEQDFLQMNSQIGKELSSLNEILGRNKYQKDASKTIKKRIEDVMKRLKDLSEITPDDITGEIVESTLEKIIITPTNGKIAHVDFYFKNSGVNSLFLKSGTVRSDDMFKKMIENQEKQMSEK